MLEVFYGLILASCAVFAYTLTRFARNAQFSRAGLKPWAAAMGCWGGAALFAWLGLAAGLPHLVTGPLVALTGLAGMACLHRGICDYHLAKPHWVLWAWTLATTVLLVGLTTWVWPQHALVLASLYVGAAAIVLLVLLALLGAEHHLPDGVAPVAVLQRGTGHALVGGVLVALEAYLAVELGGLVWGDDDVFGTLVLMPWQAALLVLAVVVIGAGLLLMTHERLRLEWQHLVSHDALTGSYTRHAFMAHAEAELGRALRNRRDVALLAIDLDNFKFTNERYGHASGDDVLRKFADITKTCLRREDIFGRVGGEEWLVMLPDTPIEAARVVAERIRFSISATRVNTQHHDEPIRFTVSVGVACANQTPSLDELIRRADAALLSAKKRGRNRVELSQP